MQNADAGFDVSFRDCPAKGGKVVTLAGKWQSTLTEKAL
jgi:hypothetical protein